MAIVKINDFQPLENKKAVKISDFQPNSSFYAKEEKSNIPTISELLGNVKSPAKATDRDVVNNEGLTKYTKGNPIPSVNYREPESGLQENSLDNKMLNSVRQKLQQGKDLSRLELDTVKKYGLNAVIGGDTKLQFDLNAKDNPLNTARFERVKTAVDKQSQGEGLTDEEQLTLDTAKVIADYNKARSKQLTTLTADGNQNKTNAELIKAEFLYNDSAYDDKHIRVGNKEFEVDENNAFQVKSGKLQKQLNRVDLYANTGAAQYSSGLNTAFQVIAGISPEKIAEQPDSAYAIANSLLQQHYKENGEQFNIDVQNIVVNTMNNLPAMAIGMLSSGALLSLGLSEKTVQVLSGIIGQGVGFAPSVFGNAYKEGTGLGVTDNGKLWHYALATTGSELLLQYAIGGIPYAGGVLSGDIAEAATKNITNGFFKFVVGSSIKGGGEFVEESAQSLISPLLQKWLLGVDVETVFDNPLEHLSQAAYEGYIGFASSFLMGAANNMSNAVTEAQIQQYGKYCTDIMSNTDTDVKNVAAYIMEVYDKKSSAYKAAETVNKGDTSDYSVGVMMNEANRANEQSKNFLYETIGNSVKAKGNGITQVLEGYEALSNDGLVFPPNIEDLYMRVKASQDMGLDISSDTLGEFTVNVQAYMPRAIIMRDVVNNAIRQENKNPILQNADNSDIINAKEGESYARTDEFRRLQAEMQGMSDDITQSYHSGSREIDGEIRGRLSRTFRLELQSASGKRNYNKRTLLNPKSKRNVNILENVNGELFHDVFEIARHYLENGELVDLHDVKTTEDGIGYDDCINYLSEDGLSGFSITPDGDLISVFNLSDKRGFLKTIAPIVKENAKTLDCYASEKQNLMIMYQKIFGFKTASVMDYNMEYDHDNIAENHGMPQIAFMVNTDNVVETKHFTTEQYDEAKAYRDGFVKEVNNTAVDSEEKGDAVPEEIKGISISNQNKKRHHTNQAEQNYIKDVAAALGVDMQFVHIIDLLKERGIPFSGITPDAAVGENGKIYMGFTTTKPVEALLKHELSDMISFDKVTFQEVMNTVFDSKAFTEWVKTKGYNNATEYVAAISRERVATGDPNFVGKSANDLEYQANIEITSDFIAEQCFGGEDSIKGLVEAIKDKPSFKERITQWLKDLIAKIKNHGIPSLEMELRQIEKTFAKAFNEVQIKNTADNSGMRFSIANVNNEILLLINKVKTKNFKANEKVYFENVSDTLALELQKLTGIDVRGFRVAIEARQIEHILKDHGENGLSDHSMSNDEDIAKIEYVLKNADNIENAGKTQAYTYMKDGHNKTAPTIKYEKLIGNKSYYVVQAVPDTKAQTLFIVTAYIGNSNIKKEASQLINAKSPDVTTKIGSVVTSNNNIPENNKNVNNNNNLRFSMTTETAEGGGVRFSIGRSEINDIQSIGRKSVNDFNSEDIKKTERFAKKYFAEMGVKSPFFRAWFGDWRAFDNSKVKIATEKGNNRGLQNNIDTGWDINVSSKIFNETKAHKQINNITAVKYLPYINDIIKKAVLLDSYGIGKQKSENSLMMHSFYCIADIGNGRELLKLYVEEMNSSNTEDTGKRAYQLQNIENQPLSVKGSGNTLASSFSTTDIFTISDLVELVKKKEKSYNPKPVVKELLNENGTPKEFYHGTRSEFTVFKKQNEHRFGTRLGDGFYFTSNYDKAFKYANGLFSNGQDRGGKIMSVYLKIENPFYITESNKTTWNKEIMRAEFDGIIDTVSDMYYVEEPTQIKSATDNIGTFDNSNSDIRFSMPTENIDNLITALKNGEISEEDFKAAIGKKTETLKDIADLTPEDANTTPPLKRKRGRAEGDKTSNAYESLLNSKIFDEQFKNEVRTDKFIEKYRSVANKETLQQAADELDEGGQNYVNKWFATDSKHASLIDTAVGFILMDRYQRVGDYESATAVAEKVREIGTASGQQVQLFSILGRLDPNTMAVYAQKELSQAFKIMSEKRTQRWIDKHKNEFELTDEDIDFIRRRTLQAAMLPEGRDKAIKLAEIATRLQDKMPHEKGQSVKALQRVCMLLNPKTNIRNVMGNGLMAPVFIASDFFGSGIDKLVSKKTGVRTTGNFDIKSVKGFKKGMFESLDDYKRHINTRIAEADRFEIGQGKSFNENHKLQVLNDCSKVLNALDRFTSFCLDMGDRPFYEMWFMNSLNNQIKLNNVTEATPEMIAIASAEALQRTWQDNNKVVKAVAGAKKVLNGIQIPDLSGKGIGYGLGDMLIKFTKTPANLTKAIFDFSPVGLLKAISADALILTNKIKKGEFEAKYQKNFVDNLSKGIAGTLLYTVAAVLAANGLISGGNDDDKDVRNFENYIQGIPEYSIKIFGKWISYDWAQPLGSVLAIVSDYMKAKEENPDNELLNNVLAAIKSGGEVLYNQSFMKSIQILFTADGFIDGVFEELMNEPSIYIPQLSSQIANATDDYRRMTYVNDKPFETALNKVKIKIPGARQTLPKQIDTLGREVKNSQNNIFNAFFNPGNTYTDTSNKVTDEVYRIYKQTGKASVIPKTAPYDIKVKGIKHNLSIEEKNDFQRISGNISAELIEEAMKNSRYKALKDEEKAELISEFYNYATAYSNALIDWDYEALSAMVGERKDKTPILSKELYNKLSSNGREELAKEYFLSKREHRLEGDTEGLVGYYLKRIEK